MKTYLEFLKESLSDQGSRYNRSHNNDQHPVSHEYNKPVTYKSTHGSPDMSKVAAHHHGVLQQHGYKLHSSNANEHGDVVHLYKHSSASHPPVTVKDHASGHTSWMVHDGHGGGFHQRTHQQVHATPHTSSYNTKNSLSHSIVNHKANSITHDEIRHGDINVTNHPHLL